MAVLRIDIERALDELISQEEGMRFQGLAVILGKQRWPHQLTAYERKKDFGLDAYAPASQTPEKIGKGLAASISATFKKVSADAKRAKDNFSDLKILLFMTPAKIGNADQRKWKEEIQREHGLELLIIEREDIIIEMMRPENASLGASFLYLHIDAEPQVADLIDRTRRAAANLNHSWDKKTKGYPLLELTVERPDQRSEEPAEEFSLEQIDQVLLQGGRIILEAPAGRGKTTTLIQLARRVRTAGTPFIVELPAWTSSRRGILEFIAGTLSFQAERLTPADLACVQQTEPFLFLLNGWNEVTESNSTLADEALRELEREFPGVGIIIATRTHHLMPPLPSALRLRLLPLQRQQRAAYLAARLGAKDAELRSRIDADPSLDELTRTPFILSEVTSLFEAGAEIPSTKIGIIDQVLRLEEQRIEHSNALQSAPIFGRQTDYLTALASEMTQRGAVTLSEEDARPVVAAIARELTGRGLIDSAGAPTVLATLTAHHVLERVDYPHIAFRFEHQLLQEYYAARGIQTQLLDLVDDERDATDRFTAKYVNDPAWTEPLSMVVETLAEQTGDSTIDKRNILVGATLVKMALAVDLVFAGQLARLCGRAVWRAVGATVGQRFRAIYAIPDKSYPQFALAAMLATGAEDFSDIIVPLLSGQDHQTRLKAYRLWPDIQVTSLGRNWRDQVRIWADEAREDFVSELLHHRVDSEIAAFAAEDKSAEVKKAAAYGLMWTEAEDDLIRVLDSMDAQTFEDVVHTRLDWVPAARRHKTVLALRKFIDSTTDHAARLRTAVALIRIGEAGLDEVLKDAMTNLPRDVIRNIEWDLLRPGVEYLRKADPAWITEWVAVQTAEGVLYRHAIWLPFLTAIPDGLAEKYLVRIETGEYQYLLLDEVIALIAARADAKLAARVFAGVRDLRRKLDAEPSQPHELEGRVMNQLADVFRGLPDDIAADGILSCVTRGDPLDIKVTAALLSRVARLDREPTRVADNTRKEHLRAYLKSEVGLVLLQDDFYGGEKANLASAIAQVGEPEDMADLVTLIRADIQRVRRGRAARAAGDNGPLGHGGSTSYARWHIAAVMHLDPVGAEQVLIELLPEPEYVRDVAAAMARAYLPKPTPPFNKTFRYDEVWATRDGGTPPNDERRVRFAAALNSEIKRQQERDKDGKLSGPLKDLANALAAVDGRGSAAAIFDVIAIPERWSQYTDLAAAERLLMAGVVLPTDLVLTLVDSCLERLGNGNQSSDRDLLHRSLTLCPFVENPAAGIVRMGKVLREQRFGGYELCNLIAALGESRSEAAINLLHELVASAQVSEQYEDCFINALAALNTPCAREQLLSFVDPDLRGVAPTYPYHYENSLVARLAELANGNPEVAARLLELSERDLPEYYRQFLSKILSEIETPESLAANLNLINDAESSPIPRGLWDQIEGVFVELRPHSRKSNTFTRHAQPSNELRARLFRMALEDRKRRKSAFLLLGKIEMWRLEYGRPTGELRHPNLASGEAWPLTEP